MKVAMYRSGMEQGVGFVVGDQIISFTRAYPAFALAMGSDEPIEPYYSILEMLQDECFSPGLMMEVADFLKSHDLLDAFAVDHPQLLAPISRPPKIVALGRNYVAHAKEMGHQIPAEPTLFQKASTSVVGPEEQVIYHEGLDRVDHEIELALVIGKLSSRVSQKDAMDCITGYTIINDVTARNIQSVDIQSRNPWFRSKSLDTFGPLGPWIVTPDELGDPHELDLVCTVDGEKRQSANTRDMLFKIPVLIEYITRYITLEPGDIIATGTPEGISEVLPGQLMECTIQKIGTLANRVVTLSAE